MSLILIKNIIQVFVLASCLSCNQPDANGSADHETNDTPANTGKSIKADYAQHLTQAETLNYNSWDSFWKVFATATKMKDTAKIIALTHFPFSQNSYPIKRDEFSELWISQTFEIVIHDTPALTSGTVVNMKKTDKEELPGFDSVRYTHKNGKDFYFAKVNGYYKLVEIVTPG